MVSFFRRLLQPVLLKLRPPFCITARPGNITHRSQLRTARVGVHRSANYRPLNCTSGVEATTKERLLRSLSEPPRCSLFPCRECEQREWRSREDEQQRPLLEAKAGLSRKKKERESKERKVSSPSFFSFSKKRRKKRQRRELNGHAALELARRGPGPE